VKTWFIRAERVNAWRGCRPRRWIPKGKGYFLFRYENIVFRVDYWGKRFMHFTARGPWSQGACTSPAWSRQWKVPSMKKKQSKPGEEAGNHLAAMETTLFNDLMALLEHCATRRYDDGDARETGWFTIKTQGAAWVCTVKDPDTGCSFSTVGDTVDKALSSAALLLACEEAPWELDRWLQDSKQQKKKKAS